MLYTYKAYLYLNEPVPGRFNSLGLKNRLSLIDTVTQLQTLSMGQAMSERRTGWSHSKRMRRLD